MDKSQNGRSRSMRLLWLGAAGMLAGSYDLAAISVILVHLRHAWHLTGPQVSWLASAPLVGMLVGGLTAGVLADRFGRRALLILDFVTFFVAALMSSIATDYAHLLFWRAVVGIGIGADFALIFPYLAEWLDPASRGAFMAAVMWIGDLGQLLAYGAGSLLQSLGPDGFRWTLAGGALLALFTLAGRRQLLESIAWERSRIRSVPGILRQLLGSTERSKLLSSAGLWFLHQVSGQGLTLYLPLLMSVLLTANAAASGWAALAVKLVSFPAAFFTIALIDRWGRRRLQILGFLGRGIALAGLAALLAISPHAPVWSWGILMVIALGMGAMGPDKTTVISSAERFATPNRAAGQGLAETLGRTGGIVGVLGYGYLSLAFSPAAGLVLFAGTALMGGIITWRWLPETAHQPVTAGEPVAQCGG